VEGRVDDFRAMADAIETEIRAGRMRPGIRLAPQREFARQHGIATSTAARVYQELERRGLVSGEIGRGTFVLSGQSARPGGAEPGHSLIDLEANFPVLPEQALMVTRALSDLFRAGTLGGALQPVGPSGGRADRQAVSQFLTRDGWVPDPDDVLFTGSGRQGIAAAIAALVPSGQHLGVEEFTYPVVKSLAHHLGVHLVPVRMDEHGLDPVDLARVHREVGLHAVYLQPSLHNPLGVSMPPERRAELSDMLVALDLTAIEDGVNCFLRADRPLVALAPAHTVYVDSLSKRVAPGLNLGIMITPQGLRETFAAAIRAGAWTAPGFALAAAGIVALKRTDAATRQAVVLERLAQFTLRADPAAYHAWWELPAPWQPETFVAAAARHGIAISPAAAFAVPPAQARAVRLSNSSPSLTILGQALDVLADLARRTPEDSGLDY
jgi:DNA-binding transcriptional MocR family regulator